MNSSAEKPKGAFSKFITIVAFIFILYNVIYVGGFLLYGGIVLDAYLHIGVFIGVILSFTFLLVPAKKGSFRDKPPWYDIILALLCYLPAAYYAIYWEYDSWYHFGELLLRHILLGWLTVALLIEASRRLMGVAFSTIIGLFAIYPLISNHLPGILYTRGYTWERLGSFLFTSDQGLFGMPLQIAATIVVVFLLFSQMLFISGAGKFFIDLSLAVFGRVRGGPAKGAVLASGFFGMLSGSSPGNVAATGTVTIPLMKRTGYKPEFAAGVESVASLGGMFMPPVMGAVIFILIELVGISYIEACFAAFIPAWLYYVALLFMVDFEAAKTGLKGIPKENLPSLKHTIKSGIWFVIPILVLLYLLIVALFTPQKAALWSLVPVLLIAVLRKEGRIGLKAIIDACEQTVRSLLTVGIACGAIGVIIGATALTGLGINLSTALVNLAGGNMIILALLTGLTSFIMGMGMGVIASYVFLAILVAPALTSMGVPVLAAHLFCYFYGQLAFITAPVAVNCFVAAGIAECNPFKTSLHAMRLGGAAYIVPFAFLFGPALILIGSTSDILVAILTALIGIISLAAGLQGYLLGRAGWWERIFYIAGSIMLILPGTTLDIVGAACIALPTLWQVRGWILARRSREKLPSTLEDT